LIADTKADSDAAKAIDWTGGLADAKLERLKNLRLRVQLLLKNRRQGPPMGYGFPMYQGDKLYRPVRDQYLATLREGFLRPTEGALVERLRRTTGAKYLDEYNALKTYLLLGDKIHLQDNADWETAHLVQLWAGILRRTDNNPSERDTKLKISPHVSFYVDLLKDVDLDTEDQVVPEELDRGLIERTRDILTRVGPAQRYYDQFVTILEDQKLDESGPATPENLKYPPVTLQTIFSDRPDVLNRVRSSQRLRQNKWMEVRGLRGDAFGPYETNSPEFLA
jgi:type VI secretion system protein ImpL